MRLEIRAVAITSDIVTYGVSVEALKPSAKL